MEERSAGCAGRTAAGARTHGDVDHAGRCGRADGGARAGGDGRGRRESARCSGREEPRRWKEEVGRKKAPACRCLLCMSSPAAAQRRAGGSGSAARRRRRREAAARHGAGSSFTAAPPHPAPDAALTAAAQTPPSLQRRERRRTVGPPGCGARAAAAPERGEAAKRCRLSCCEAEGARRERTRRRRDSRAARRRAAAQQSMRARRGSAPALAASLLPRVRWAAAQLLPGRRPLPPASRMHMQQRSPRARACSKHTAAARHLTSLCRPSATRALRRPSRCALLLCTAAAPPAPAPAAPSAASAAPPHPHLAQAAGAVSGCGVVRPRTPPRTSGAATRRRLTAASRRASEFHCEGPLRAVTRARQVRRVRRAPRRSSRSLPLRASSAERAPTSSERPALPSFVHLALQRALAFR